MQSFDELNLSPALSKSIKELGFEKPSPIQAEALPLLLGEPTDFLGLAATGTGKTAAFGIPLLEKVDPKKRVVQCLILCPTRELALQVAGQINLLGKHKGIRALPVYGGASYSDQIFGLKQGATVVVGTPGRVIDHLERKTLRLDDIQTIILDEADEMISMGFKEDLETIMKSTPRETSNIWLFSATMGSEVRKVAHDYLRNPKQVHINKTEVLSATIEQFYYMTRESDKPEILCKLIDANENFYGLVFCQTKSLVADLAQYLHSRGYKVDSLHGDKDQKSRERTMQSFRDHKVNILICTDVASRGLDVKDITHVINYSLPRELDNYVHRIGRTARSGKTGVAMNLVTSSHRILINRIERMTKSRMLEGKLPTRKEIGTQKVSKFLTRFQTQKYFNRAVELMDDDWKSALSEMSKEEVAGRFLAIAFPEVFQERDFDRPETNYNADSGARPKKQNRQYEQKQHSERQARAPRSEHSRTEHSSSRTEYSSRADRAPARASRSEHTARAEYPPRAQRTERDSYESERRPAKFVRSDKSYNADRKPTESRPARLDKPLAGKPAFKRGSSNKKPRTGPWTRVPSSKRQEKR